MLFLVIVFTVHSFSSSVTVFVDLATAFATHFELRIVMFFSKDECDIRTVWGYTFEWTHAHQTKDQLRPLTYTYDVLASECLDRLDQLSPPSTKPPPPKPEHQHGQDYDGNTPNEPLRSGETKEEKKSSAPRRDLYALLLQHQASDPLLSTFHNQLHTIPAWVDWDQIARGQAVFYRYGGPAIVSLTFQVSNV